MKLDRGSGTSGRMVRHPRSGHEGQLVTWRRTIEWNLQKIGTNWKEGKVIASDKNEWKRISNEVTQ